MLENFFMEILFSPKGQNAKWLSPVGFPDEKILQKYIEDNPHSIPLSELKEDANMVIICREFLTSHGGKIDHIGIDEDGEIYIIETKQYSNSDKRHVVSQVHGFRFNLIFSKKDFQFDRCSKTSKITITSNLEFIFSFSKFSFL